MSCSQFGGKLTKALAARYSASPNWSGGKFANLEPTAASISYQELPGFFGKQLCKKEEREPLTSLPLAQFATEEFLADGPGWKSVWFGHSALLLRIAGLTVFVDPMLGPNAAPISPMAVKRYSAGTLELIAELPEIDLLLLTHDHYSVKDWALSISPSWSAGSTTRCGGPCTCSQRRACTPPSRPKRASSCLSIGALSPWPSTPGESR